MNLIDVTKTFKTEDDALEFLEKQRWPDGIRCPTCGNDRISKITRKTASKNKRTRIYQCLEKTCKQQFSATSGTIYGDSHIPLRIWFMAVAFIVDAKKGMSALQLQRHLGLKSYESAWYLCHRIRAAMQENNPEPLSGIVEIDETYIGGHIRGKGVKYGKSQKKAVMGAVQRGGQLRFQHVPDTKISTIRGFVVSNVSTEVDRIMTDQHHGYPTALAPEFTDRHETVNHIIKEYARGDVFTNTIESAFSLFKRGIVGSFHKISVKHLHRYLSEFEMRFNERENPEKFELLVSRMCQTKTMPYQKLIA